MAQTPANDRRYRPFRIAMYSVYIAAVAVVSIVFIISVVKSVREMTPGRLPATDKTLTVRECLKAAESLMAELERERQEMTSERQASAVDEQWTQFRVTWLQKLRRKEAECATAARSRAELGAVFRRLDQVMDLYTTHAVQYAGEIGGAVDAYRAALEKARQDPAAGKVP